MILEALVVATELRREDPEGVIRLTLRPSRGNDFVIFWDDGYDSDVPQLGEYVDVTVSIANNQTVEPS